MAHIRMYLKIEYFIGLILLLINILTGATFYVAPHGDDSYSYLEAQNTDTPWKTIKKAVAILEAGDSLIIKEGIYYESDIEIVNSGTRNSWITITNEFGSRPVITGNGIRGILISGDRNNPYNKSNIWIKGLTFRGYQNDGISIFWSDYIICDDIHAFDNGNAGIEVVGSNHVIIQDCILHHNGWNPESGWGDGASINNHYFDDPIGWYSIIRRNLMYANWQKRDGSYWDGNGFTWDMAGTGGVHIMYQNVFVNNGGYGVLAGKTGNMAIIHNVLFRNTADFNRARTKGEIHISGDWVSNTLLKNNIIYGRSDTDYYPSLHPIMLDNPITINEELIKNNFIWGDNEDNTLILWQDKIPIFDWINNISPTTKTGDPKFVSVIYDNDFTHFHDKEWIKMDIDEYDFRLKKESELIDTGDFLTKVVGSGSGSIILVEEARYFTDGFGIVDQGDYIKVGVNEPVKIIQIDYNTNIITLERSISWLDGDLVSYPYTGSAPDIGVNEYGISIAPLRPKNPVIKRSNYISE